MDWKAEKTDSVEEKLYHNQHVYEKTVDAIEMTKPKVSLLSIYMVREEQEKHEECKNIRKAWRNRVPTQYQEDERELICRMDPRDRTERNTVCGSKWYPVAESERAQSSIYSKTTAV